MQKTRSALESVLPYAELYWLAFNATIQVHRIAMPLVIACHSRAVAPFVAYACLALEADPVFSLPKFLTWRCQLVAAMCQIYNDCGAFPQAEAFVERGAMSVRKLKAIQALEPVPAPSEILEVGA